MIKEAIILAGGLGTRLREAVPDLPKCMAPVDGRPFLFHVINYLRSQGIERFIFSLGYRHEAIESYLAEQFSTLSYQCVIEDEPLGTGGAIQLACSKATDKNVVVTNGDTLFRADIHAAARFHTAHMAECTLLLKPMRDFDRYGVVDLDDEMLVKDFKEKKYYTTGTINGGLYLLNKDKFADEEFPDKFSFEKDYLEKMYMERRIYGQVQDRYFIDIGIPEDFTRAQTELGRPLLSLSNIDKSWTLFLDRDGVINHEKKEDYILDTEEFQFYDGVKEAIAQFSQRFGKIIIVTNQRGIGKGLMTEKDLAGIHQYMVDEIEKAGGRINDILYCTSLDNKHPDRKPNPGMAYHAQHRHAGTDLSRALIAGNKPSDMLFGKNAGLYSVFIASTNPEIPFPHPDIDARFDSLAAFAKAL